MINFKKEIANCYHNKKDYQTALKYYNEILTAQPDNLDIKSNKAIALHALKQYDEAISLYQELLTTKDDKTIKTNLNDALVSRGHELIEAEDYEKAVRGAFARGNARLSHCLRRKKGDSRGIGR